MLHAMAIANKKVSRYKASGNPGPPALAVPSADKVLRRPERCQHTFGFAREMLPSHKVTVMVTVTVTVTQVLTTMPIARGVDEAFRLLERCRHILDFAKSLPRSVRNVDEAFRRAALCAHTTVDFAKTLPSR